MWFGKGIDPTLDLKAAMVKSLELITALKAITSSHQVNQNEKYTTFSDSVKELSDTADIANNSVNNAILHFDSIIAAKKGIDIASKEYANLNQDDRTNMRAVVSTHVANCRTNLEQFTHTISNGRLASHDLHKYLDVSNTCVRHAKYMNTAVKSSTVSDAVKKVANDILLAAKRVTTQVEKVMNLMDKTAKNVQKTCNDITKTNESMINTPVNSRNIDASTQAQSRQIVENTFADISKSIGNLPDIPFANAPAPSTKSSGNSLANAKVTHVLVHVPVPIGAPSANANQVPMCVLLQSTGCN